ncbi:MAG: flavodoxin family protein [Deltaproteobacteria bacterium]|jgi:multimeric flavodoxin WrbA|nr:flavodoxin family protein [Deltaproteobacteria bacterium]
MTQVLAFSGSPIKGGTIEKGLRMVLDATGAETTELVRLSTLKMGICTACKKCAHTNRCVIDDDVNTQLEKIEKADAIIMSGYPSFGSINALSKVFIERNWPLRHNYVLTKGKAGAAVVAGGGYLEELSHFFENYFDGYLKTDYAGTLALQGNVPCMTCGYGEDCEASGFLMRYGQGAKVTPDKFYDPDKDPEAKTRAKTIAEKLMSSLSK